MARPRVTITRTKGEFIEIWMNPEGRDLLVRELLKLGPNDDHFHIGWDMHIDAGSVPYRPEDIAMDWGKVHLRLDEWDSQSFPHVMVENKRE